MIKSIPQKMVERNIQAWDVKKMDEIMNENMQEYTEKIQAVLKEIPYSDLPLAIVVLRAVAGMIEASSPAIFKITADSLLERTIIIQKELKKQEQ
jgi:hypothetical protein